VATGASERDCPNTAKADWTQLRRQSTRLADEIRQRTSNLQRLDDSVWPQRLDDSFERSDCMFYFDADIVLLKLVVDLQHATGCVPPCAELPTPEGRLLSAVQKTLSSKLFKPAEEVACPERETQHRLPDSACQIPPCWK
jgi:hypothetical protein